MEHTVSFTVAVVVKLGHPWYGIHHSFIPSALTGLSGELTLSGWHDTEDEDLGITIQGWKLGFDTRYWNAQIRSPMQIQMEGMILHQAIQVAEYASNN